MHPTSRRELGTDDIEQARLALIEYGAPGLGEIADGSLAELGAAPVTRRPGASTCPARGLAVVQLANGNKLGLRQSLPAAW